MTTSRPVAPRPPASRDPTDRLVGDSPAIRALRDKIRHLAIFDTVGNPDVPTLLLHGETGTGKGLVARVVHGNGPRARAPFIDAYGSLTPERRRALHAGIVESVESLYADRLADQVERLAHHAFRGEVWGKAATNFWQAGARAAASSANREAAACFEQALVAVQHLPESREKREQAIDLRSHLGNALVPLGEFGRIIDHLREAETLAEALGDRRRLARVSSFMSFCVWMTGDHDRAVALGQRALAIAETLGDLPLQIRTNFYIGQACNAKGDYRDAIDVLRRTVVSLEAELRRKRLGMAGFPAVFSRSWLAWCLAELGEFAEGAAIADEGMRIAEEADHPFSLAVACSGIGILSLRKGDLHRAISVLERGLQVCQTWHIPLMFPWVASAVGYAYALAGRVDEALPLLEQAVDQAASVGILGRLSIQVAWLGEVHLLAGRISDADRFAQHALDLSREHKERGHEAWVLRLLAEVAGRRDPPEAERAETFYHERPLPSPTSSACARSQPTATSAWVPSTEKRSASGRPGVSSWRRWGCSARWR